MKFTDLKRTLEVSTHNIYFIYGEDRFLMQKAKDMLIAKYAQNAPEMNLQYIETEDFSMQKLLESASAYPFGNDFRLIIVQGVPEKIPDADQKAFENYIKNPVKQTVIAFIFDDAGAFYQKNKINVELIDCAKLDKRFLSKFVASTLAKSSKSITVDAVDLLIDFCECDLTKIENECEKLAGLDDLKTITKNDILKFVPKSVDYQIFELTTALGDKDSAKAVEILSFMLGKKVATQLILSTLLSFYRRLFYSAVSDGTDASIAKNLNVKEYAITMTRKHLKNFKKIELKNALEKILSYDYLVKSGKMDDEQAIYALVLELCQKS